MYTLICCKKSATMVEISSVNSDREVCFVNFLIPPAAQRDRGERKEPPVLSKLENQPITDVCMVMPREKEISLLCAIVCLERQSKRDETDVDRGRAALKSNI